MPRTTVNIEEHVLRELQRLQKRENKSLGTLMSELLADALARRSKGRANSPTLRWRSRSMGAKVNLDDKDAVYAAMEDN